jgi:nitrite reductase (NADH) large subunit
MKKQKLVVVGNGMAGMRAVEELLKLAPDLYDITVFGAEPHPNYNRILLSPVLAGEMTINDIILNPLGWYADNGIRLHVGKTGDEDRPHRAQGGRQPMAPRKSTTACCWPRVPRPSCCRCPATICPA